jgi:ring-1,2-phenylacetyl-CoA epoxidase subunit PaaC
MTSKNKKIEYSLHLADTALIMGQRNSEWCAHGPILEQDIAITNITLDHIGQARNFYQYAASLINELENKTETEDTLAYLRNEREFKNLLICELPNGDWAQTVLRLFFFSAFQQLLLEKIIEGDDKQLSAIAAKSIKETNYHLKWSSEWVIRLGDGTEESHQRMKNAIEYLWMYTGEFFIADEYEMFDVISLKEKWLQKVKEIFDEATLTIPENTFMQTGGKKGVHTEHLGYILSEMQYLQRTYPCAEW